MSCSELMLAATLGLCSGSAPLKHVLGRYLRLTVNTLFCKDCKYVANQKQACFGKAHDPKICGETWIIGKHVVQQLPYVPTLPIFWDCFAHLSFISAAAATTTRTTKKEQNLCPIVLIKSLLFFIDGAVMSPPAIFFFVDEMVCLKHKPIFWPSHPGNFVIVLITIKTHNCF